MELVVSPPAGSSGARVAPLRCCWHSKGRHAPARTGWGHAHLATTCTSGHRATGHGSHVVQSEFLDAVVNLVLRYVFYDPKCIPLNLKLVLLRTCLPYVLLVRSTILLGNYKYQVLEYSAYRRSSTTVPTAYRSYHTYSSTWLM